MTYGSGAEDWRVQNVDIYEDIALDTDTEDTRHLQLKSNYPHQLLLPMSLQVLQQ